MNIKEHIEAGHYEKCAQTDGWNVTQRNHCRAIVFSAKCGGAYPLVGVVSTPGRGWTPIMWAADGTPERTTSYWGTGYDLMPPSPRKVKVTPAALHGEVAIAAWNKRTLSAETFAVLKVCAAQFRSYEKQHLAKGTQEGRDKADVNGTMAAMCEEVLARNAA